STDDEDEDDNRRRKKKRKRSKKQSQEKTDKEGENSSETAPESDPSQDRKQEKKRKKKGSKSVEDADRPQNTQQRKNAKGLEVKEHLVSHHDSSDLRPDEKESESGADEETDISVLPPALQKKKKMRKLKKTTTRDVHDEEKRDDVKQDNQTSHNTSAAEHTSREEEPSSDSSAITTPLKKRKLKKMKTRDVHDGEKTDDVKQENYSGDSNVTSAREEEPSSDPSTPKKRKTKQTSSDQTQSNMTARKSERVRGVKSEAEESHELTNTSKKKKKKTLKSLELNGDTTEPKRRKTDMMNGHAASEKTPKTLSDLAPAHSAKATSTWFKDHGIPVLNWPANSPDLNPIENLWGIVKRKMRYARPNNAEELKATIRATWALITPEQCHRLIDSMPRRIAAVIQAKGAPTKY
ncbi:Rrp1 protein, partial [Triplophysa rosa]